MSGFGTLFDALGAMYGQISSKEGANKHYKTLVPMVKKLLKSGTPYKAKDIQRAIETLKDLAPVGARGRNFERKYLKNKQNFLLLPEDPNEIMYGFWW